ncbi:hypothetical protein B7C42_03096 [Nocardia cerradoensis]|uniref:ER-bound oxygenase mpaB/mpaB'/Rubber oxygenase catalytic domain-containing protein n=1 Tax=Nocardia cerradoensis TaxID=85688 RepID=A0A231H8G6_9NOCA|nr:oxygenase MpaB family protein [Nocardia cerradoensis]OXR45139.1 hypothetical protein B7C42_03096 [Nocardia cerradoensis]
METPTTPAPAETAGESEKVEKRSSEYVRPRHRNDEPVDWALGPGSVSWKVMKDPAVFVVGLLREALLLTLHPAFAAAAADHDSFGDDPVERFRHVAIYTYGATYGTRADAERVSQMVRRRHAQIVGIEPLTLIPYRAHSEYELALTSAMLTASFLAAYEELHGQLTSAQRDQFVQEQKVPAALLGIDPKHLPSTYGGLIDYIAHARSRFATGLQARETLSPFATGEYPAGTAIGDLPFFKRKAAMFAARAVSDMAILTMTWEERELVAINRRPKLGTTAAVRLSAHLLSAWFRSDKGMRVFDGFVKSHTAEIFRRAREADAARGGRTRVAQFQVPDASAFVVELPDLLRNWPGSVDEYTLGNELGRAAAASAPVPKPGRLQRKKTTS